jgi:hypothetical protein
MLGCEDAADPVDLLAGRPAGPEESSDRLVLTAEAVVMVVVVVAAGPEAEPRRPLLHLRRLIHPRQLMVYGGSLAVRLASCRR